MKTMSPTARACFAVALIMSGGLSFSCAACLALKPAPAHRSAGLADHGTHAHYAGHATIARKAPPARRATAE